MTFLAVHFGLLVFGYGLLALAAPFVYLLIYSLSGGKSTDLLRVPDRDLHPWRYWLINIAMSFLLLEVIYGGIFLIKESVHQ
jgi:hypothetical protein